MTPRWRRRASCQVRVAGDKQWQEVGAAKAGDVEARDAGGRQAGSVRIPVRVGARSWKDGLALSWRPWRRRRQHAGGPDRRSGSVSQEITDDRTRPCLAATR
jgi:hypothetical protein